MHVHLRSETGDDDSMVSGSLDAVVINPMLGDLSADFHFDGLEFNVEGAVRYPRCFSED